MVDQNSKDFVDQLLDAWNTHDLSQMEAYYSPNYEGQDVAEAGRQQGSAGIFASAGRYFQAFPDIRFSKQAVIQSGDQVAIAWQAEGTHLGSLMNIPPTGCRVTVQGMSMLTVRNGRVTEGLYVWDVAGLLRAINLLPEL